MIEHPATEQSFSLQLQAISPILLDVLLEVAGQRVQFLITDGSIIPLLGCLERSVLVIREVGIDGMHLDACTLIILGIIRKTHHHTYTAELGRHLIGRNDFVTIGSGIISGRSAEVTMSHHCLALATRIKDGIDQRCNGIHCTATGIDVT